MPTPASAAIVAMGTRGPSRCTAAVAARTRASWLRAASLRGSRELRTELRTAAMCLLNLSLSRLVRTLQLNGRNHPLTVTAAEAARRQHAVSACSDAARRYVARAHRR